MSPFSMEMLSQHGPRRSGNNFPCQPRESMKIYRRGRRARIPVEKHLLAI
jgi:hypothetical protein